MFRAYFHCIIWFAAIKIKALAVQKEEVGQKYNYTLTRQLLVILREFSLEEDITSSLSNGKSSLL